MLAPAQPVRLAIAAMDVMLSAALKRDFDPLKSGVLALKSLRDPAAPSFMRQV
jgi:hypothetical protein